MSGGQLNWSQWSSKIWQLVAQTDTDASKRHWASGPLLMSKVVSLKKVEVFIKNKHKFIEDT